MSRRIGLYGGTFDPPHLAHIDLAKWAVENLALEALYFIPTALHPLKENDTITPAELRFSMLQAALGNRKKYKISRIEMDQDNPSYTVDTLRHFRTYEHLQDAHLVYLMGIDNVYEMHLWKEPDTILELAEVTVFQRPGYDVTNLPLSLYNRLRILQTPFFDISATSIREKVKKGEKVAHLLPAKVYHIIQENHLYRL